MLTVMRKLNSNDIIVGIYSKEDREKRFNEIETWLKSLRPQPHWKPSMEQMNVLKEALFYFGNSWVSHKQEVLESLYNDLKKLI